MLLESSRSGRLHIIHLLIGSLWQHSCLQAISTSFNEILVKKRKSTIFILKHTHTHIILIYNNYNRIVEICFD